MVLVKFFGYLKSVVEGLDNGKIEINVEDQISLKRLIEILKNRVGDKLIKAIFDDFESFKIKDNIILLHNGKMETDPDKIVKNSDTISIMPFVSGGLINFLI